jgi:hypothetical protein
MTARGEIASSCGVPLWHNLLIRTSRAACRWPDGIREFGSEKVMTP